ncbi:MAG: hypothetical protein R3E42_17130 [Burkholderiaceae bacterium]
MVHNDATGEVAEFSLLAMLSICRFSAAVPAVLGAGRDDLGEQDVHIGFSAAKHPTRPLISAAIPEAPLARRTSFVPMWISTMSGWAAAALEAASGMTSLTRVVPNTLVIQVEVAVGRRF